MNTNHLPEELLKVLPDALWQALLQRCASNPKKAVRLVMVNREDVEVAAVAAWEKLKGKQNESL